MAAVNVQAKHYPYLSYPKRARSSNKWRNTILQHVKKRITNPLRDMMKKMKTKTKLKKSSFLESSRPSIQTVPRKYDFSTDFSSVSSAKELMPCFQTAPPKYDIRNNIEEYDFSTDSSSVSREFMLSRMPYDSSPGQGQVEERLPELDMDYYTDCMVNYVASKLQENITSIRCPVPDCAGLLEPEYCRPILPPEVFDRWGSALCEAVILGSEKFYCPYKDCSAMLIDVGTDVVRQSACPNCWRMFCAQCKVPWHEGIKCEEFLKLNKQR